MLEVFDQFFALPLDKWPIFENQSLAKSKLILRADLRPQVDMFNSDGIGLGLRDPLSVVKEIALEQEDRRRLNALLHAGSYDVYSVRATLSPLLSDDELAAIKIPDEDQEKLQKYLNAYSHGLLEVLLDGTDVVINTRSTLASVLKGEVREQVLANIAHIAEKLGITPPEIVVYVARLSEMILAVSYYRRVFEATLPRIQQLLKFVKKLHDVKGAESHFPGIYDDTQKVIELGRDTLLAMKHYFDGFMKVENFFATITPDKFRNLSEGLDAHYRAIGYLICFWQIRIDEWERKFAIAKGEFRTGTLEQRYIFFKESIDIHLDKALEPLAVMQSAEFYFG
ncbi:MAG: hypothetical protein KDE14_07825 [Rhodobacteraceae bacterium]|nr:hypothetical protein [Paracoccaceae bacterium]